MGRQSVSLLGATSGLGKIVAAAGRPLWLLNCGAATSLPLSSATWAPELDRWGVGVGWEEGRVCRGMAMDRVRDSEE